MERFSVLDTKPSRVLDFPLTVCQQIWLIFLLPTLSLLVIYIVDIATDLSVGLAFISEGEYIWGGLTIYLLYLPALVSYGIRLSSPPDTRDIRVAGIWFMVETVSFILFPIRPLQCMGERLFWSIEALRHQDPEREEALLEYESTRVPVIEKYLFLQAFLQAGPQAILQAILLLHQTSKFRETQVVEAACVLSSLMTVALVTSSYQRYETQVRGGRLEVFSNRERTFSTLLNSEGDQSPTPEPQRRWIKVMGEDNPIGRLISFTFWFLFLFGRVFSLVLAGLFYPYAVIAVCGSHYLFNLAYILPSPDCTTSLPSKVLLAILYVFCLVEVKVPFRKSPLFYTIFFVFSFSEDAALTLVWALGAHWTGHYYIYAFYVIGASHALALLFLLFYFKFFQPRVKRLEPM